MGSKIGIDVGGTFTDFLLVLDDGSFEVYKTPSTPEDPSIGLLNGLAEMAAVHCGDLRRFMGQVDIIVHGTTVTTNAVLTDSGARTALLTSEGFRDALEMRRGIREKQYDNRFTAPPPLVPRYLRLPIPERIDADGREHAPLDEGRARAAIDELAREGVEAIAISFLHSYANSTHEQRVSEMVRQALPDAYLSVSSELLPQVRFYERTSTTVLNSYVGPVLRRFLEGLTRRLAEAGFQGVLLIMQSSGGVTSPQVSIEQPVKTLLSGPAAGPLAGALYARGGRCITVDMGGTSFDAALVQDGAALTVAEGEVNRRRIAVPMLDIHTIGAGGGSIAWLDGGGLLHVGPRSAGAQPGPACYGRGGVQPTCTDADLVLGYLAPDSFLGGRMPLRLHLAEAAIETVARPLGMSVLEAAAGIYRLVNANMADGIRAVSVRRGLDAREFPLVVAGGAGPVHAAAIALEMEIPRLVVPRESSVFCATGMLLSDLSHELTRTLHGRIDAIPQSQLRSLMSEMEREGEALLARDGVPTAARRMAFSCDLRYAGQYHEVTVPLDPEGDRAGAIEALHEAHDRLYGYASPEAAVELINLRLKATGLTEKPRLNRRPPAAGDPFSGQRPMYLPSLQRMEHVPVYAGERLAPGSTFEGPAIVELPTTTVIVLPEYSVSVDELGSFVLTSRSMPLPPRLERLGEGTVCASG